MKTTVDQIKNAMGNLNDRMSEAEENIAKQNKKKHYM